MPGHEATHEAPTDDNNNPFFFSDPYGAPHDPAGDHASELDSSEDEVIFSGRQPAAHSINQDSPQAASVAATATATAKAATVVTVVDDDIPFLPQQTTAESPWSAKENTQDSFISLSTNKRTKNKKRKNRNRNNKRSARDENAIYSDYVRNVTGQDGSPDPSSDEELPRPGLGLSSKDKDKFRALSTLNTVEESEVLISDDISDDDDDDDDDDDGDSDSDSDASLEKLLSHIRRGASFTMVDDGWGSDMLEDVDFDIIDMQQDGPLKKNKKKKKGRMPIDFGLSDSDMELHLNETYAKDRSKKKAKKREREKLRAEGLLGKKKNKNNGRPKDLAFGIDELKVELRKFLQSPSDSLGLPPMKKHHRKVVHEIANALGLSSQSRGGGSSRFPILYKTKRTPNFNGKHSVKLDKILDQPRFSHRLNSRANPRSNKPKSREQEPKDKSRGRSNNMAVSYLEGEVVGGSAPEIGAGNKGRAMLEKMGWSTGTALGASNNKGILQPVAHVVKNTRAGLG